MKTTGTAILTAFAIAATACCGALAATLHSSAADETEAIRIMAVGDSITHGYINNDNGYRKYLCYYLQQAGITNFDMVGPENSWTNEATYNWNGTTITYDPQHAGYSGYTIQAYGGRSGIYETLFSNGDMIETYQPDVILLQIGTNDVLDAQNDGITDRLETLIERMESSMDSDDMLFVASIPDIDAEVKYDWLGSYEWTYGVSYSTDPDAFIELVNSYVDSYNASIQALVEKRQAEGDTQIHFSNINSAVDMKTGLEDGVHPNEDGYACMGQYWANLLTPYLNGSIVTEPVTTTTAEEPLVTSTESLTTTEETTLTEESTTSSAETSDSDTESATTSSETTETTATGTQPELLLGDVNLDEQVTLTDVVTLTKYLLRAQGLSETAFQQGDMDANSKVNGMDLALLRQRVFMQRTGTGDTQ